MSTGWYVTANDISNWTQTNNRQAQGILPRLVRDLIYASVKRSDIKYIRFPSGDSIALKGWDGTLNTNAGNEYVPSGFSGWECGTNQRISTKAEEEYSKIRANDTGEFSSSETTFIFVTSRIWQNKDRWRVAKEAECIWKEVRVVDAIDLECWLHQCPAVHKRFANLIGKIASDVQDINEAWDSWASCTSIKPTSDFILLEREQEIQAFSKLLESEPKIIQLKAFSLEEAFAFCLASIRRYESLVPRALIVRDQSAWDTSIESSNSLILIPKGFIPSHTGYAITKGHHIISFSEVDGAKNTDTQIVIGKMSVDGRIKSLTTMGFSQEEAYKIYNDTHGFFQPMRRHRLIGPMDDMTPKWVGKYDTDILMACLLATEWDCGKEKDKGALSKLSGISYTEFEGWISNLAIEEDPPIRIVGDIWQIVSKTDLWSLIRNRISKPILDRLEVVIFDVLCETDPSFDLIPDERWLAKIESKVPEYSWNLKLGLADSLALLAVFSDNISQRSGVTNLSGRIDYWVKTILDRDTSARGWYSLRNGLIPLAEASPDSFLFVLESAIYNPDTNIKPLFESGNVLFSSYPLTSLLWALETVSWNLDYLPKVCLILAKLSEIDPGGNYANRPFNTLRDIFLGWINNTVATHEQRLEIIDSVLIKSSPGITWNLLLSLLPQGFHDLSMPLHKPKYHDWAGTLSKETTNRKYFVYIQELGERLLSLLRNDPVKRWPLLIKNLPKLTAEQFHEAISIAKSIDTNAYEENELMVISDDIRRIVSNHREFTEANWKLQKDALDELEEVYEYFKPENSVLSNLYLFNEQFPQMIEPLLRRNLDIKEVMGICEGYQKEALATIYNESGIDGIKQLARISDYPGSIGVIAAKSDLRPTLEGEIIQWLGNEEKPLVKVSQVFVFVCSESDREWLNTLLRSSKGWEKEKYINLLLALPFNSFLFEILKKEDSVISAKYWKNVEVRPLPEGDLGYVNWVLEQLLINERALDTLQVTSHVLYSSKKDLKLDCNILNRILRKIVSDSQELEPGVLSNAHFHILRIIKYIQTVAQLTKAEIAQIEWMFLGMLRHEEAQPDTLIDMICNDPSFFVTAISWIYPEKNEAEEDKFTEIQRQMASNAWNLLDMISLIPGFRSNGSVDEDVLARWVHSAREELKRIDRISLGDHHIGQLLSRSPAGVDGIWPHVAVRNIIEALGNHEVESGLRMGKMNLRGFTSRAMYEGGKQERELAKTYFENAEKIRLQWPRTSAILRDLGNAYERDAEREDREVELER